MYLFSIIAYYCLLLPIIAFYYCLLLPPIFVYYCLLFLPIFANYCLSIWSPIVFSQSSVNLCVVERKKSESEPISRVNQLYRNCLQPVPSQLNFFSLAFIVSQKSSAHVTHIFSKLKNLSTDTLKDAKTPKKEVQSSTQHKCALEQHSIYTLEQHSICNLF